MALHDSAWTGDFGEQSDGMMAFWNLPQAGILPHAHLVQLMLHTAQAILFQSDLATWFHVRNEEA
jgi:hypothetical protein